MLSLIIFYQSNTAHGRGLTPAECGPACTCYTPADVLKIAGELTYAQYCRYTLTEYEKFAATNHSEAKNLEVWQEPSIVIGGIILTAGVSGLIGYLLGARK